VWVSNVIRGVSSFTAPEGNGVLAVITLLGSGTEALGVFDGVFMDHNKRLNYVAIATEVEAGSPVPAGPFLAQNYPNPFNPITTIRFGVTRRTKVSLEIYNVQGRLVRTLLNDKAYDPGSYTVQWNSRNNQGREVGSGVYLYRLKAEEKSLTKKMVLIR